MANIKTSISIEKTFLDEVDALAKELGVSRSRVFTLAARDFVQRKNRELLEAINAAVVAPTAEETELQERMRKIQGRLVQEPY